MSKATDIAPSYYQLPRDSLPAAPWTHINAVARGTRLVSPPQRHGECRASISDHKKNVFLFLFFFLNAHLGESCFNIFLMGWSDITVISMLISTKTSISESFMHFKSLSPMIHD